MGSGFPIDLILFGMIAAFLVLRLRNVLGRRTGFERPPQPVARPVRGLEPAAPVIDGRAEPPPPPRPLPERTSPVGQALVAMEGVAPDFDPVRFVKGAESAFRLIVEAFAAGNRDALRPLLTEETLRAFEQVIATREAAGQQQKTEIKAVREATIAAAELRGSVAAITVRFVSDQTNVTLDRTGNAVAGADAVTEITDLWTFERDLKTADPNWRLAAARSA